MAIPLQKERENRSAEKKDLAFHPFSITPETAQTSVLLLESDEPEILCQTLHALTKFASQDYYNRQILFDLNAIKYILPHVDHEQLNVRRFALKGLAQLCQLPLGPEIVLENPEHLHKIAAMLLKTEDIFVLEFATLVLAELTREPHGCEQLVNANILGTLFSRMKNSEDPDVQKNSLDILINLISDPVSSDEVTKSVQFSWPSILFLLQSKYVAIQQGALTAIDLLICRVKDYITQKSFRASTGILDMFDLLESFEFRDIHAQVLQVLGHYVESEENAQHVYMSGCMQRLLTYLELAMPACKTPCLAVLTKMSYTASGRSALYEVGADLEFCNRLLNPTIGMVSVAATGVANMTQHLASAKRMADTELVEILLGFLSDDMTSWFPNRVCVLQALKELCRAVAMVAYLLVEPKSFNELRKVTKNFLESPVEAQRISTQLYINLLNYHLSKNAMMNNEFIHEMINSLQRPDIQLKIYVCNLLTGLMIEEVSREFFTANKGEKVISDNLRIEHVQLRGALCDLIATSVTPQGAENYLRLGAIHYLVSNKMARFTVPSWEVAIETIFNKYPAAKFAYTGRLDITDITNDGFYVLKRLGDRFPALPTILQEDPVNVGPVLILRLSSHLPFALTNLQSKMIHSHDVSVRDLQSMVKDDYHIRDYISKLMLHFDEKEFNKDEVPYEECNIVSSTLKDRAQYIAEFVVKQMNGLTQDRDCSMPSVDLHLAELMAELSSPVVGLGFIRCGGPLERSLLFKALCDRLAVPCALLRLTGSHVCCQIAVPEVDQEDDPNDEQKYPAGYLRVNYVVDLMDSVGKLHKIGSLEAKLVCPESNKKYVAGLNKTTCLCDFEKN